MRDPQRGVAEPEPVMLARHPDIATKNRAVTREVEARAASGEVRGQFESVADRHEPSTAQVC